MFDVINFWDSSSLDELVGTTAAFVTAIGVILGGLALLWRKVLRPMRNWVRRASRAFAYVERELSNNGGSTVKDKVDELARSQALLVAINEQQRSTLDLVVDELARIKVRLRLEGYDGPPRSGPPTQVDSGRPGG